jgi:hypothetical protein
MEKLGKHGERELAQEVLVDGKMVAEAKVKTEGGRNRSTNRQLAGLKKRRVEQRTKELAQEVLEGG